MFNSDEIIDIVKDEIIDIPPEPEILSMEEFLAVGKKIDEKFKSMPNPLASGPVVNREFPGFDYTKQVNFDHLIGAMVRREDMVLIGQVCNIQYSVDGYGQNVAFAEVAHFYDDNVTRINCRNLIILK